MANPPAGIIFVNSDISDSARDTLVRQLLIDNVQDGYVFDDNVNANPNYVADVKRSNLRVLVLRTFAEFVNRANVPTWTQADVVLFVKQGLAYAEINKFGPPGISILVLKIDWGFLVNTPNTPFKPQKRHRDYF